MTIIGINLEDCKVLLDDGVECQITDVIGSQAVVALPNGMYCTVDIDAPKMTKQ